MDGTVSSSLEGNETRDERVTADDTTDSSEENSGQLWAKYIDQHNFVIFAT